MRLLGYADTTPHSKLEAFSKLLDSEKLSIPGERYQNSTLIKSDVLIKCLCKYGSKMAERDDILRWRDEEVFPVLAETENTPTTQQDDISPEVLELARAIHCKAIKERKVIISPYQWEEVKDDQLRKAKRLLAEADTLLTGYACSCFLFDKIDRAREVEAFQGCIQKFLMNGWKE